MAETPAFAVELAKFALLTNAGRINTTMACTFASAFIH
jgi:Ino eighty subunit 1